MNDATSPRQSKHQLIIAAFNRPDHLSQVFSSISPDIHLFHSIVICIDGLPLKPSPTLKKLHAKVIHAAHKFAVLAPQTRVFQQRSNQGLKKNILFSIEHFSIGMDSFTFLEDDIVVEPGSLPLIIDLLEKYKSDEKIVHINMSRSSSLMHMLAFTRDQFFTSQFFCCWGWASWPEKWSSSNPSLSDLTAFLTLPNRLRFSNYGFNPHLLHLYANYIGLRNTWAIHRKFFILSRDMLTLTPSKQLCKNIGMDGSGTHESFISSRSYVVFRKVYLLFKSLFFSLLKPSLAIKLLSLTAHIRKT